MRTVSAAHHRTALRHFIEGSKLLVFFFVITALVVATGDFASAGEISAKATTKTYTLTQLEGYISNSSKIEQVPNLEKTTPPLQYEVSDGLTLPMTHRCYAEDDPLAPKPDAQCVWGDKKATKSIFLFGDSQAASWLPAFNQIGKAKHYKVYFLAEASCPPWEPIPTSNFTLSSGMKIDRCISIRSEEIHFANLIHPTIVVLAGDTNEVGNGSWTTSAADYESEMATVVSRLMPIHSKIVLLSEVPQYNVTPANPMTPATCLTVHGSDVIPCLLSPQSVLASGISQALIGTSEKFHVSLIDVLPLFCSSQLCPLTVETPAGTFLTHYDEYHMSKFYSKFISTALTQLMSSSFN